MDRIGPHVDIPVVKYKELRSKATGETSQKIRERAIAARDIQVKWFSRRKEMYRNAEMQSKDIQNYCRPDSTEEQPLKMAVRKLGSRARESCFCKYFVGDSTFL